MANQQTVVITGALTGIGRATALAFGKLGANLVVSGRRQKPARHWRRSCAPSAHKPNLYRPTSRKKLKYGR